jgi:hypothetical protein
MINDQSKISIKGSIKENLNIRANITSTSNWKNFNTAATPLCNTAHLFNEKLLRYLKEMYSRLSAPEFDKSKFYPNIIVTGGEKSGKTSLIEYLTSIDLFPRSYFSKKVRSFFKKI